MMQMLCENCGRRVPVRKDGRFAKHNVYLASTIYGRIAKVARGWKNPVCTASGSQAVIL